MSYVVIDVEASSLSRNAYPIEFAFGNRAIGVDSFLIDPSEVAAWTDWDTDSERVHQIPRAALVEAGLPAVDAWTRIAAVFARHTVYSDAPKYDRRWLEAFSALGVDTSVVRIRDTYDLIRCHLDNRGDHELPVADIYRNAAERVPPTHRAARDVEYLLHAIDLSR